MSASRLATGGTHVVDALIAHGTDTVFCVPGESYLPILDALYDVQDRVRLITCRHESGAAFMATAYARLRHRAGVVFVTRGPGATNASIALHVAHQASIPLVVGVGQVPRESLGREAFQEIDYTAFLAPLAKHVEQVERAADLPAAFARAFRIAEGGRAGPVVLALPEDMLGDVIEAPAVSPWPNEPAAPDAKAIKALRDCLGVAQRPLVIAGGGNWSDAACADLQAFVAANDMPVMTAFRRQDIVDHRHPCFAGYLGYSAHEAASRLAEQSDCVVVLGARLDDPTTHNYRIWRGDDTRVLIHVHPDAATIGRNYLPTHTVIADVRPTAAVLAAAGQIGARDNRAWCERLRAAWLAERRPPAFGGALDVGAVMGILDERLPRDRIIVIDAGNFSRWPQRYLDHGRPARLLGAVNGAMGHGVPAAVGAAISCPDRQVVACVGDGGMLMTGMELATAARHDARPLIVVFDNRKYGTIETHQDRRYPGRRIATDLDNPDFAALARSFGQFGESVTATADFAPTLEAALKSEKAAVIALNMNE